MKSPPPKGGGFLLAMPISFGRISLVKWRAACLRLGRGLRIVFTAASLLFLLLTVIGWCQGYSHWRRISIWRESMSESGYRLTESRLDLGAGDFGLTFGRCEIDAEKAIAMGCPIGVRRDPWFFTGKPQEIRRSFGPSPTSRLPEYQMWRWEHSGIILGWMQHRDTLAAIWGKRMPGALCNSYYLALPWWIVAVLFALLPALRLYALIKRKRQTRPLSAA
jgi:hypothetical protein